MGEGRFSEEQIVSILKELKAGYRTAYVCQQHGISEVTLFNWRSKYGGPKTSDSHRGKQVDDENYYLFDTIDVVERRGQVKCFGGNMYEYSVGDDVPSNWGPNFSIAMREGGYVNVAGSKIASWTDVPAFQIIIDKFGNEYKPNHLVNVTGTPEPYLRDHEKKA